MKRALFPGTFDPVTKGHMDIITRAAKMADELIIGISTGGDKQPIFSIPERVALVEAEVAPLVDAGWKISVHAFDILLMKYVEQVGAQTIVRGLRGVSDFDYEFMMSGMNQRLNSAVETVFLMASQEYQVVSSRFVKEICRLGGDISPFVSPAVATALKGKFG
jgi:pantetheine-phosphate adenylyltransferase